MADDVRSDRPGRCHRLAWAAGMGLVAGCASYGPGALAPGASPADAMRAMGRPSGEYALPDGGRRIEYARGPMGRHTYMLDFDAGGRLTGWAQVLTEARFDAVRAGTGSDELLRTLGRPSARSTVGIDRRTVWSYRYDSLFCQWYQVSLDAQGRVTESGYGPDPLCYDLHEPDPL